MSTFVMRMSSAIGIGKIAGVAVAFIVACIPVYAGVLLGTPVNWQVIPVVLVTAALTVSIVSIRRPIPKLLNELVSTISLVGWGAGWFIVSSVTLSAWGAAVLSPTLLPIRIHSRSEARETRSFPDYAHVRWVASSETPTDPISISTLYENWRNLLGSTVVVEGRYWHHRDGDALIDEVTSISLVGTWHCDYFTATGIHLSGASDAVATDGEDTRPRALVLGVVHHGYLTHFGMVNTKPRTYLQPIAVVFGKDVHAYFEPDNLMHSDR